MSLLRSLDFFLTRSYQHAAPIGAVCPSYLPSLTKADSRRVISPVRAPALVASGPEFLRVSASSPTAPYPCLR